MIDPIYNSTDVKKWLQIRTLPKIKGVAVDFFRGAPQKPYHKPAHFPCDKCVVGPYLRAPLGVPVCKQGH